MKILVTVGTTPFDSLIKTVDECLQSTDHDTFLQIAKGKYHPKHFAHAEFLPDIATRYKAADLIISHAGAGTIYQILELKKRLMIVPNLERADLHQLDIAQYMHTHQHALVCFDLAQIATLIWEAEFFTPHPFVKEDSSSHLLIEAHLQQRLPELFTL